ncbi:alpha/beta fold hydrolase [Parapedomonas caeni]
MSAVRRTVAAIALASTLLGASAFAQSPAQSDKPYLTIEALRAKYQDPAGRIANIDGAEVYYKDEGQGPAILMVHGSASSLRTWDRIADRLKSKYRVIRYDIPGYGLSGRVSDEVAKNVQPTDIAEKLLAQLGVNKITFVGVSSGGTLGMFLAARRPDLVERLILSNTPSDPVKTDHLVMPESFIKAQAEAKATGFQDMTFWNEYLSYFAGDPKRISAAKREEYYDFNRRTPEKYPVAMVARIGDGKEATTLMSQVKAPTLLLWGGSDHLLPESAAYRIAEYLKQAQISRVIMPDVGHYPPVEVPERFEQLLSAYIEAATPNR